jgi:beta-lactamase class A
MSWTRRNVMAGAAAWPLSAAIAGDNPEGLIAQVEKRAGGRLGVAALDTQSGRRIAWRAAERFAMCSTFKLLLVGAVLRRVDTGQDTLDRRVDYDHRDLLDYAPVARAHLAAGHMTIATMAEAAIVYSDNTCANLLLASLGGPPGVTAFARMLGDGRTRLDRTEPALNTAIAGDVRDTTTPNAMLDDLDRLMLGPVLEPASRASLKAWLIACKTADKRTRAGLPPGWTSGNKTGTGENGATNDVAILWPPGRKPVLLAVYFTESAIALPAREAVIADVARVVTKLLV